MATVEKTYEFQPPSHWVSLADELEQAGDYAGAAVMLMKASCASIGHSRGEMYEQRARRLEAKAKVKAHHASKVSS